tara:strand:- start:919 stop:1176 length:258 start_codon:yes stop_codon:yes gene_type:complete
MVGDKVWANYGSSLRFGVVVDEKFQDGWKFCNVNWVSDESFETSDRWKWKMRGENYKAKQWYRIDEINPFDVETTIQTLDKLELR